MTLSSSTLIQRRFTILYSNHTESRTADSQYVFVHGLRLHILAFPCRVPPGQEAKCMARRSQKTWILKASPPKTSRCHLPLPIVSSIVMQANVNHEDTASRACDWSAERSGRAESRGRWSLPTHSVSCCFGITCLVAHIRR